MTICLNGQFLPAQQPVVTAQSPAFKWGEGVFETIKLREGRLLLATEHFERLFTGLRLLRIAHQHLNAADLQASLVELCRINDCSALARIRLSVFRTEENSAAWIAEALPLPPATGQWRNKGLTVGIYPHARKSQDVFSTLKTSNYLLYMQAARYAQERDWDDAILLNASGHLCDSSRANLFIVREREIYTPDLGEGCVQGVIRRCAIDHLKKRGYAIHQQPVGRDDLLRADEAFLTNAIQGLQPIGRFEDRTYGNTFCSGLFRELFPTIYVAGC